LVEIAVPLTMEQKRTGSKLSITKRPISNRRAITQSIQIIGKVVSKKMKKKASKHIIRNFKFINENNKRMEEK